MAVTMWCPNCEQKVGGEKSTSNLGCVVVLMFIGTLLAFFFMGPVFGGLALVATVLTVIGGLVWELMSKMDKPTCPICKTSDLETL